MPTEKLRSDRNQVYRVHTPRGKQKVNFSAENYAARYGEITASFAANGA